MLFSKNYQGHFYYFSKFSQNSFDLLLSINYNKTDTVAIRKKYVAVYNNLNMLYKDT